MAPTSIFSRKRDLIYLVFFLIHIPVLFCVDLVGLYPPSLTPRALLSLRAFYIATYRDRFFTHPPAWFRWYLWLEAAYHVPLSLWAVGALWRGREGDGPRGRVAVHLLVYAVQTAVTTGTCVADFLGWEDMDVAGKGELAKLYVPYLGFAIFMGVDMYVRLNAILSKKAAVEGRKKGD